MRKFQSRLQQIESQLPDLFARQKNAATPLDEETFRHTLLDGSLDETFDLVDDALHRGVSALTIVQAITLAATERCLRFNIAIDQDKSVEEGWLDVTHCFTYASALREALLMQPSANLLRALYQAARFVHYVGKPDKIALDLPSDQREAISDPHSACEVNSLAAYSDEQLLHQLAKEMDSMQHLAAMHTARGYLIMGRDASKLTAQLIKYALADSAPVPIVQAHTIKMTVAAVEEFHALGAHPHNWLPLVMAVRFLAAPKTQRFVYYGTLQAIDFVANQRAKEA
jgi:hypothetical protein